MATELEEAERGRNTKGETAPATAKANGKRKIKKDSVPEEVPIAQSSIPNSHNHESNGAKSKSSEEDEQVEVSGEKYVVDESVRAEDALNGIEASKKKKKEKAKKEVKEDGNQKKKTKTKEEIEEKDSSLLYQIPMNRVIRIIKSEDPNIRITQEAVYVINKASEKFLQLFATEAYASAFLDRKKNIDYKHLSSVVSKRRRFDFLSDFVPEKVKVEDALKESPAVEN